MSIGFGFERLGHLTLRFPRTVAVAVVVFTVICVSQFAHLSVDGNILRIYRNSGEMYDRYQKLGESFGTFENDAYLLARSDHLTDPETLEKLRNLAFDLELSDFSAGTLSPFALRKPVSEGKTAPAVPEDLSDREEVRAALTDLREHDPMMHNLISADLKGIVMIMFPDQQQVLNSRQGTMLKDLRALAEQYSGDGLSVQLTGPPVWKAEMLDATVQDQIRFSVIGFAIGAIMSLICLRSFWGAVLATLTPLISVVWVVGVVVMLFGSFTFLTNIVTTLVLVIAFAESMYFCFTWLRLWNGGMDPDRAIGETVIRVTPAAALTSLTTMVSFASLIITQGQGIEEFGISGLIAVGITFVTLVTFLPLALKVAIRLRFTPPTRMSIAVEAPIPVAQMLARRFSRTVSVLGVIAMIALFYPHFAMQPRFDFQDFLPRTSQALQTAEGIDKGVGGVAPIYVEVPLSGTLDSVSDSDFARIQKVHRILESHVGKDKVISAASFSHYTESGFSREQIFKAVGPFLKHRFISEDGKAALVTGFLPTVLKSEQLRKIVNATDADLAAAGLSDAKVSGFNVLTAFASTDMIASLRNGLTIAVLVNIAIIGLAFRSWRVALVAITPNFVPILGTELYLYVSGAGLQLTTVIALTIAFGIAVDDTIHFLATYKRARADGYEHVQAVQMTLERIGPALVATTIILCAGTFVVIFSSLPQVALFGSLTVLTFVLALIGDLVILPSMLIAGRRFFQPLGEDRT